MCTDFEWERELLLEAVLAELQYQLVPLGLDVQIIDYHHGSTLHHGYHRHLFDQHLAKIRECAATSLAPVCLVHAVELCRCGHLSDVTL